MSEESFTLKSFAKINWFLRVFGKRDDNFHELCTVFQTVSLHDTLTFFEDDKISLTCDDKKIPTCDENLIVKAAKILQSNFAEKKGARIHLQKNIPSPGGLGGGSSNAATALIGLTKLWKIRTSFSDLLEIGKEIGSDVPFFFYGGTAIGSGRGTEITSIEDLEENFLLIVTPDRAVSTAKAFARLNVPNLTNKASKSILQICRDEAETLDLRQSTLTNDFEKSVFEFEPEIRRVKEKLLDSGGRPVLMSGSGASVFAVFDAELQLQNTSAVLESEQNWRVFSVKTISRQKYRDFLDIEKLNF